MCTLFQHIMTHAYAKQSSQLTTGWSYQRALRVSKNCRYTGPSTAPCFCLHPYFPMLDGLHLLFAYIPPTINDPVWYTLCKKLNWFIHTIKANINNKNFCYNFWFKKLHYYIILMKFVKQTKKLYIVFV